MAVIIRCPSCGVEFTASLGTENITVAARTIERFGETGYAIFSKKTMGIVEAWSPLHSCDVVE